VLGKNRTAALENMVSGKITCGAGDNFTRATLSIHGDLHDVVNMGFYHEVGKEQKIKTHVPRIHQQRHHTRSIISKAGMA
jgi:hypothetical protein